METKFFSNFYFNCAHCTQLWTDETWNARILHPRTLFCSLLFDSYRLKPWSSFPVPITPETQDSLVHTPHSRQASKRQSAWAFSHGRANSTEEDDTQKTNHYDNLVNRLVPNICVECIVEDIVKKRCDNVFLFTT